MTDKREILLASLDKQFFFDKGRKKRIVSSLCGLQAQFANNPGHALRIRADDFASGTWHDGLVKTWTFRNTLHAVRKDELGLFLSAQGVPDKWDGGWGLPPKTMARWSAFLLDKIGEGVCDREALKIASRKAGMTDDEMECAFHGWGGLIKEMAKRGLIAYVSGTAKRFVACGDVALMDWEEASAILLERYFRYLGPATMADCANFFGCRGRTLLELLKKRPLPLKSIVCEGVEYWYLGKWNATREIPPCLFLAGFDQLLMAYKDRSRLVDGKHKSDVVTNTGIVHPTVLVDGSLKAKWRKDGRTLVITPFAKLTRRQRRLIDDFGGELFGGDVLQVVFNDEE
ncbi:MAG: winged helix DNA-binding domain-containing protein [Planctomycetota bacterium]|jgi:hypothetical protein|nr:winged helix DNA-binding domain-containing protein [Planctomycetota bacterium]